MRGAAAENVARRRDFQAGRAIQLADGQEWTFPSPRDGSGLVLGCADDEYYGLIRALVEAENEHERLLAELAMAIFLLLLNYDLAPEDLEFLLTFSPGSSQLRDLQQQFRALAADHLDHAYGIVSPRPGDKAQADCPRPTLTPLLPRLRAIWQSRRWPVASHQGEVLS